MLVIWLFWRCLLKRNIVTWNKQLHLWPFTILNNPKRGNKTGHIIFQFNSITRPGDSFYWNLTRCILRSFCEVCSRFSKIKHNSKGPKSSHKIVITYLHAHRTSTNSQCRITMKLFSRILSLTNPRVPLNQTSNSYVRLSANCYLNTYNG